MPKKIKKEKVEYNIPKGWKVWRVIRVLPYGSFGVIAQRNDIVAIFTFDGFSELPQTIMQYQITELP